MLRATIKNLFTKTTSQTRVARSQNIRKARLGVEALENLEMLSATPTFIEMPTDMVQPAVQGEMVPPAIDDRNVEARVMDAGGTLPNDFWAAIGYLQTPAGSCTATLISSQHVLTAAHCVNNTGNSQAYFSVGGPGGPRYQSHQILRGSGYVTNRLGFDNSADIALIRLRAPVSGVTPFPMARATPQVNELLYLVGFGMTGTGQTGQVQGTGNVKRWGATVIDYVSPGLVHWQYNQGKSSTAQGDSGGPQLRCNQQTWNCEIVSVTSGGDLPNYYGSWAFNTRVDIYANAISSVISSGFVGKKAKKAMKYAGTTGYAAAATENTTAYVQQHVAKTTEAGNNTPDITWVASSDRTAETTPVAPRLQRGHAEMSTVDELFAVDHFSSLRKSKTSTDFLAGL